MADPSRERDAVGPALQLVAEAATRYLGDLDAALVRPVGTGGAGDGLAGALPEEGAGSLAALRALVDAAESQATRSAGPRFFHFVMGGGTPAALAADWLTSALDQIAFATAGEVNGGAFDPIAVMADLAERYGAWLHVDGAFGLFAAVSPATRHLVRGVERAHSVAVDGHKWLNVPYDCGAAFVHDAELHRGAFTASAAYLGRDEADRPVFSNLGPEMSRRARALAVWATLRAYGRGGYRAMVERHVQLAQRLAGQVDAAPDLERLAEVPLNVVCFRYRPRGVAEGELDELNRRLGQAVLDDGRVYFGTTVYEGKVAFRPAIVNWRTEALDVDLIVPIVLELGARIRPARASITAIQAQAAREESP